MSRVKLNQKSFNNYVAEYEAAEQERAEKQLNKMIKEGKSITVATLPKGMKELNDINMKNVDRRVTRIIEKETAKVRFKRSQRKLINTDDIRRSYTQERVPTRGHGAYDSSRSDEANFRGTYIKKYDKHKGHEYVLRNITSRERKVYYWFGSIPGMAEGYEKGRKGSEYSIPVYASSQFNDLYQPSKYPTKYKEYVYMPYIANTQSPARDYIYWTDENTVVGQYKRNTYDKDGNLLHKKGEPIFARYRSTGDKAGRGGTVDRTWHNKNNKGYIDKIIRKINRISPVWKQKEMPVVDLKLFDANSGAGTQRSGKTKVTYVVSIKATNKGRFDR